MMKLYVPMMSIAFLSLHSAAQQCIPPAVQVLDAPLPAITDQYGGTIEMDQGWMFVSQSHDGFRIPLVHVYGKQDAQWVHTQTISPPNSDPDSFFGIRMALDDNRIAIAAPYEGPNGVVYIYALQGGVWSPESTFEVPGDDLGNTFSELDLDDTTLVLGYPWSSRGTVFVAELQNDQWSLSQQLQSPRFNNATRFGSYLRLQGDELAIADPSQFSSNLATTGAVHIFARSAGQWEPVQEIEADRDDFFDELSFGWDVDFDEQTLAIGAREDQDFGVMHGAMHIYKRRTDPQRARTDGPWERIGKVYPPEISDTRRFGWPIAVHGDTIAVTALSEAAYDPDLDSTIFLAKSTVSLYRRQGESWFFRDSIDLGGDHRGDYFGRAFALSDDQFIVGVPFVGSIESIGQVLAYDISCLSDTCVGDLTLDGQLNFYDVSAFLSAYLAEEEIADLNQDGDLNFLDVSVLLSALASGC
jgi:hypothetical protein